jgi:hypothetical protein
MERSLHFERRSNRRVLRILCMVLFIAFNSELPAQDFFNSHSLPHGWNSPPILRQRLLALAEEGALSCGHASPSLIDASEVTECAFRAYSSKRRFYVQYDVQGIDSELAVGFAFDEKEVYAVTWVRLQQYWRTHEIIHVEVCPIPTELFRTGTGRLNCFPPDPNAKRNILSPELNLY